MYQSVQLLLGAAVHSGDRECVLFCQFCYEYKIAQKNVFKISGLNRTKDSEKTDIFLF